MRPVAIWETAHEPVKMVMRRHVLAAARHAQYEAFPLGSCNPGCNAWGIYRGGERVAEIRSNRAAYEWLREQAA